MNIADIDSGFASTVQFSQTSSMVDEGAGSIEFHGSDVTNRTAYERKAGFVFQNYALFNHMTVAENIALRLEKTSAFHRVRWTEMARRTQELLHRIGAEIDPTKEVRELSMPEQQLVEIACALGAGARIVIMDEHTASLPPNCGGAPTAIGAPFDMMTTSFFLGRQKLIAAKDQPGMALWRERLFAWMSKSSESAMESFKLPTNRVVELGSQLQI